MDYFLSVDWSRTFAPQLTLPEILIRGTVVYFALLALLRVVPKWQAGPGSISVVKLEGANSTTTEPGNTSPKEAGETPCED